MHFSNLFNKVQKRFICMCYQHTHTFKRLIFYPAKSYFFQLHNLSYKTGYFEIFSKSIFIRIKSILWMINTLEEVFVCHCRLVYNFTNQVRSITHSNIGKLFTEIVSINTNIHANSYIYIIQWGAKL